MTVSIEIVRTLVQADPQGPLQSIDVDDLPGDWRVWFEERASIMEFEGGLPRERAEALALQETVRLLNEETGGGAER